MTAPWLYLSRWRALPNVFLGWVVVSEAGAIAVEPSHFQDHAQAQRRADELNAEESAKMRERLCA